MAADGHLCVHTVGSFGLLGLGHSFYVLQPRINMRHTEKWNARLHNQLLSKTLRRRLPGGSLGPRASRQPYWF